MALWQLMHLRTPKMGQDVPVIFSSVRNTYSTKFLIQKSAKAVKVVMKNLKLGQT